MIGVISAAGDLIRINVKEKKSVSSITVVHIVESRDMDPQPAERKTEDNLHQTMVPGAVLSPVQKNLQINTNYDF